ncbi:MAG: DNA internalization-related competence protein ComEC/Rec2 [Acidobacteriota bacterium]
MLSWLAGVGLQMVQAAVAPPGAVGAIGTISLAILMGAVAWRHHACARWGVLALIGLAWASTSWRAAARLEEQVPAWAASHAVQARLQIDGLVQELPGGFSFEAHVQAYQDPDGSWRRPDQMASGHWPERVLIRLNGARAPSGGTQPEPGQQWQMTLRMHEPDGLSNPGGYDAELGYWERGVRAVGQGRLQQAVIRSSSPEWFWQGQVDRLRTRIRHRIAEQVPQVRWAGVLSGLAVGDQSAIERQDWEVFRQTGVSHLVSISGGHVAMFGWLAAWLIKPLWLRSGRLAWRVPSPDAARLGAVLAAWLYALLAGWGVPAQRTVLMMAVFSLLRLSGRRWPWPLVWLLAAVVVTLWDPWSCMQAGFWLSFVAVGILMSSQTDGLRARTSQPTWPQRVRNALAELWRTQWRVTLGLAPLSLVFFQQTSVIGLVANLLAIPMFTFVITPLALLGAVWAPLWSVGAQAVELSMRTLSGLAHLPAAMLQSSLIPLGPSVLAIVAGAMMIWPMRWAWRAMLVPLLLPLFYLPSDWQTWPAPAPGQFSVLAADVGQGSALVVRTATHVLLFDTGPKTGVSNDAGAKVVVPLLRALGLSRLDAVMVSHADTDHIGGAESVYQSIAVNRLWSPLPADHPLRHTPSANGHIPEHHDCVAGQSWVWDGVLFKLLRPSAADLAQRERLADNALSCVLQVQAQGGVSSKAAPARPGRVALLTGDIEAEQEALLVADYGEALRADLLVVPHHGSKTSSTEAFLETVRPQQAIIQVGRRNRYGHPAPPVLARYRSMDLPFVTTPDCGAFSWRSDASQSAGQCWRRMHAHYWAPRSDTAPDDDESDR